MSNGSFFLTGKQALVTALIALALNPISVFSGYYLSKRLSKPDINIEYITHKIEYRKIHINPELAKTIKYNKPAFNKIQEHIFLNEYKEIAKDDTDMNMKKLFMLIMKSPAMLSIDEKELPYDFINKAVQFKEAILSNYKVKIDLLKENIAIVQNQVVFDSTILKNVPDLEMEPVQEAGKQGPEYACKVLEDRLLKFSNEKEELENIIGEFENILKQEKKERSGIVKFEIGFLNNGDTDGVIFPQGKMIINGEAIKINQIQASYEVIKPHSFVSQSFEINIDETPRALLDYFKGRILNNIPEEYEIVIKTSGGFVHIKEKLPVD